ncbi:hypothetical protein D3C71_1159640 [compost metagenome]
MGVENRCLVRLRIHRIYPVFIRQLLLKQRPVLFFLRINFPIRFSDKINAGNIRIAKEHRFQKRIDGDRVDLIQFIHVIGLVLLGTLDKSIILSRIH